MLQVHAVNPSHARVSVPCGAYLPAEMCHGGVVWTPEAARHLYGCRSCAREACGEVAQAVVLDPLPMFRRGVAAVLVDAGHEVETPADILGWIENVRDAIVVLTLLTRADWTLLADVRDAAPTSAVIALLDRVTLPEGTDACRYGATSVLARDASHSTMRRAVDATTEGNGVVPVAVLRALAHGTRLTDTDEDRPSPAEIQWLRALAGGTTVARLAVQADYSERAMYRRLSTLYKRMGAGGRVEALMRAHERGWLRPV